MIQPTMPLAMRQAISARVSSTGVLVEGREYLAPTNVGVDGLAGSMRWLPGLRLM